uniref:Regulatory protein zeste n=1 Tax=Glossina brevipalpis TaxID=37001 RepID=A0A1A9WSZ5_9MUSC
MKMEKTPRYTQRERNMVLGYAAQYKDIIENKRTDAESNRKKDEVWRQIAKEFNARVYHQRSSKQLRQLYKNMKLLLKKDLCGEGKGNRTFMDLLNTISQQESVAQYISEQMSPNGYSSGGNGGGIAGSGAIGRQQKYEDDYDDSKHHPIHFNDAMDTDVIVIKSEDISDNEHSQGDMEDDDDDCLSPKDIPEVCLEEEDEELFATDLRQQNQSSSLQDQNQKSQRKRSFSQSNSQQQQQQQQQQKQQQHQLLQPEVTIQNIGGIRVGSIGSMANMKALQNGVGSNGGGSATASNSTNSAALSLIQSPSSTQQQTSALNLRQTASEQQLQLLNGLGLSAVHPPTSLPTVPSRSPTSQSALENNPRLPALQRTGGGSLAHNNNNNSNTSQSALHSNLNSAAQQLLLNINGVTGGHYNTTSNRHHHNHNHHHHQHGPPTQHHTSTPAPSSHKISQNDYFMLGIEERKLKIELLNAQIEYWRKLTKKLDENAALAPNPSCMCHFPGKLNGVQTPASTS